MNDEMKDYEMLNKETKEALINVCKNHCYQNKESVIVPEPYIPHIPKNWNGILVLADRQNINLGDDYYKWLNEHKTEPEILMTRLEQKPYKADWIGVGPWDDGTVKLALQAIFEGANLDLKVENVAVSNAVPWTKKNKSKNENPNDRKQDKVVEKLMQDKAVEFWKEIFEIWNDIKMLIVLGDSAERVMKKAGILKKDEVKWLKLRHPSLPRLNRIVGKFNTYEIGKKCPMVQKALESLNIRRENVKYYNNMVFYTCEAVSLGVEKFKECFGT
jgi:hypothetical protein